jgi:hypothetical protein
MSALVFLLIALAISIGGSVVLWLRHRKPSSLEHTIDAFSREMQALSPDARSRAQRSAEVERRGPPHG